MELSIFLAKLIGLYLLIVSLDLLLRRKEFEAAIKNFASSKGLLAFCGSLSLILGLAVIIGHPIYEWNWRGLITLFGYLLIIRGVIGMAFPSPVQKKISDFFHKKHGYIFAIVFILGLFLTYSGFSAATL